MTGLRDKIAVVTGGSSGIGQAIAIRLGEEGVHVASTTWAVQNLTRSLALEGATVTPINRSWVDDPNKRAMVVSHIPMRRAGTAGEMAAAAAFLCSDEVAYITGQTLFVDGGLTLYPSFETTWSSE
jgi:NAD(P)-dependent dehydrogenase (short-subunit alcohol dehydrogenase family)